MYELRLIEVAAVHRHARPIDTTIVMRQRQGVLEPTNATVALRRYADFALEPLDESLCAQADRIRHSCDAGRRWRSVKRGEGTGYGRVRPRRAPHLLQHRFKRVERRLDPQA